MVVLRHGDARDRSNQVVGTLPGKRLEGAIGAEVLFRSFNVIVLSFLFEVFP
jgi:hypothetical protein